MILYYSPGACSLADHIALLEAGLAFDLRRVDLKAKTVEREGDYRNVNPKGYVPALALDDGEVLTENIAILAWIGDQAPRLLAPGPLGRYRTLEALAYISTEIHKAFKPFFRGGSDDEKKQAGEGIGGRLAYLSERIAGDYLFGAQLSVADAYLFVMLMWAKNQKLQLSQPLADLFERVRARPAVGRALEQEGIG